MTMGLGYPQGKGGIEHQSRGTVALCCPGVGTPTDCAHLLVSMGVLLLLPSAAPPQNANLSQERERLTNLASQLTQRSAAVAADEQQLAAARAELVSAEAAVKEAAAEADRRLAGSREFEGQLRSQHEELERAKAALGHAQAEVG